MLDSIYVANIRNRTVRLDRKGDYWTPDEKKALENGFYAGMGITEMAITFQRTEPAILQQIEKMDLYNRKENPSRRRSPAKEAVCLCYICELDPELCPMKELCPKRKGVC